MSEYYNPSQQDPSEVKAACLDVDGHLVDTHTRLIEYHRRLYTKVYDEQPDDDFIQLADNLVGGPAEEVFAALYPGKPIEQLRKEFIAIAQSDDRPAEIIEGVPEELERLSTAGLDLYIVTNRGADTLDATLRAGDINPELFKSIHTRETFDTKADALRSIVLGNTALTSFNVSMSGDSVGDVTAGNEAGLRRVYGVPRPGLSEQRYQEEARRLENAGAVVLPTFVTLGQTLRPH